MVWRWSWLLVFILSASLSLKAEITFSKKTIMINGKKITVELAETDEQRTQGLMHRKSLPKNQGMLFVFEQEQTLSFWMKNTFIDLSIGFFDQNKKLVDIKEMSATSVLQQNFPSYESSKPAKYALEMNKRWFDKNKIKLGSQFIFKD